MRPDKWRRRNRESQKKQRPACNGQDRRSLSQPERVLTRDGCFTAEKGGTPVKVRHSTTPYSEKHTDSELARHGNSIDQDKVSLDVNMLQIRIAKATQGKNGIWSTIYSLCDPSLKVPHNYIHITKAQLPFHQITLMPRPAPTRSRALNTIFQQASEKKRITASQTPLIAIVVASYLDRLGFVEYIDSMLTWDPTQWRVSPGNLAKAMVMVPFIQSGPRLPIYSVSEHYQQMDMDLLFTTEVHPLFSTVTPPQSPCMVRMRRRRHNRFRRPLSLCRLQQRRQPRSPPGHARPGLRPVRDTSCHHRS
jgi:hypothetical protein